MHWSKSFKKSWFPLIVVIVLFLAVFTLPRFLELLISNLKKASSSAANAVPKLCLYACPPPSPAVLSEPNAQFSVPVIVDTDQANNGDPIRGVDVVINFDTTYLTLTDINPSAQVSTTLRTFAPVVTNDSKGTFDKATVISAANSSGAIKFGAATADWNISPTPAPTPTITITSPYSGSTTLAILTFTPKKLGSTNVSFSFTLGSTTDSNLVSANSNSDVLAQVNNLSLTIANPTNTPVPSVTGTCPQGDINGDCHVTLADYSILFTNFGTTGPTPLPGTCPLKSKGDINCDGKISLADYSILFANFGK